MASKKAALSKEAQRKSELDDFNPDQFDINFDSSSSREELPPSPQKHKEEHKEDKVLLDQLGAIANLMKRIDAQLANKDRLLNSTTTTPNRPNKASILQFAPDDRNKNQSALPNVSKADLDKRKSALMIPPEPVKSRDRRRVSRTEADGFKPPQPQRQQSSQVDIGERSPPQRFDSYYDPDEHYPVPNKKPESNFNKPRDPEAEYSKDPFTNPTKNSGGPDGRGREPDPKASRARPDDNEARRKLRQADDEEDFTYKGPVKDRQKDFYVPRGQQEDNPKNRAQDRAARRKDRPPEARPEDYEEQQSDEKPARPKNTGGNPKDYGIDEYDPKHLLKDYSKEDDGPEDRNGRHQDQPDDYELPEFRKYDPKKTKAGAEQPKPGFSEKVLNSPTPAGRQPQPDQVPLSDDRRNPNSNSKLAGPSENMDTTKGYHTGSFDDTLRRQQPQNKGPISPDRGEDLAKKDKYRDDDRRVQDTRRDEYDDRGKGRPSEKPRQKPTEESSKKYYEEDLEDDRPKGGKNDPKWKDPYEDWEREPDPTADGRPTQRYGDKPRNKQQEPARSHPQENYDEYRNEERASKYRPKDDDLKNDDRMSSQRSRGKDTDRQRERDPDQAYPPGNYEEERYEDRASKRKEKDPDRAYPPGSYEEEQYEDRASKRKERDPDRAYPPGNYEEEKFEDRASKRKERDPERAYPPGSNQEYRNEERVSIHNPKPPNTVVSNKDTKKYYEDFADESDPSKDPVNPGNQDSDKDDKFYKVPKRVDPDTDQRTSKTEIYHKEEIQQKKPDSQRRGRDSIHDAGRPVENEEEYRDAKRTYEDQYYVENKKKKDQPSNQTEESAKPKSNKREANAVESKENVSNFSLKIPEKYGKAKDGQKDQRPDSPDNDRNRAINTSNVENKIAPSSIAKSQQSVEDTINIPNITYPKIKNFMSKYRDLGLDNEEDLEGKQKDAKANPEAAMERKEALKELMALGGNIVNDLDKANHNNKYVNGLKDDMKEIDKNRELVASEIDPKKTDHLVDFGEKIGDLVVEEKSFSNNDEKNKFKELVRRKSVTRIYNENEMDKKDLTKDELQDAVVHFLKDYSIRVKSLKTPTSAEMAKEAENTIEMILAAEKTRSPEECQDLLQLVAHDIKKNFKTDEPAEKTESVPKSLNLLLPTKRAEGNSLGDNNVVEFDHFLRGLNGLSSLPFSALDTMITDPSNMVNLWGMRTKLVSLGKMESSEDKNSDLLKINSISKEYPFIDQIIVALSKELNPPRNYEETKEQEEKGLVINFVGTDPNKPELRKQDSFDFGKFHSFRSNLGGSAVQAEPSPPPKKGFIDPMLAQSTVGGPSQRVGTGGKNNEDHFINPNLINSDEEMGGPAPAYPANAFLPQNSHKEEPREPVTDEWRQDISDELEYLIEQMVQERVDVENFKRQVRDEQSNKDPNAQIPVEQVERLQEHLKNCNEYENNGKPAEPVFVDLREKATPGDWRKGVLYSWPRFEKELGRLKKAICDMAKEFQRAVNKKLEENGNKEKQLGQIVEEAEEEAKEEKVWIEEQGKKDEPVHLQKLEEFQDEIKNLKEELQKMQEQKEEMERLKDELKKAQQALQPTEFEKATAKDKPSVVVPAAARRLSKVDIQQKSKEETEKLKELEDTVKNLEDIIEGLKQSKMDVPEKKPDPKSYQGRNSRFMTGRKPSGDNFERRNTLNKDKDSFAKERSVSRDNIGLEPGEIEKFNDTAGVKRKLTQSSVDPKKSGLATSQLENRLSPQQPINAFVSKVMDKYGVDPIEEEKGVIIEEEAKYLAPPKKGDPSNQENKKSKIDESAWREDPESQSIIDGLKMLAYSLLDSIKKAENAAEIAYESIPSTEKEKDTKALEKKAQETYEPTKEELIDNLSKPEVKEKLEAIENDKKTLSAIEKSRGPEEAKKSESLPKIAKDLKKVCEQTEDINQDPERREHMKEKAVELIEALENLDTVPEDIHEEDQDEEVKRIDPNDGKPISPEEEQKQVDRIQLERTKKKLAHTLDQLRSLAHAILSSIQSAKDLDDKRTSMSPLDRKFEEEKVQGQYEFSRNGMLSTLAEPETGILLQQRDQLPGLAEDVKDACGHIVKFTKEPMNREDLRGKTQEFYDALVPIRIEDIEEIKKIQEMEEGAKEEQKIKEETAKRKEERALPDKEKTLEEVIKEMKEAADDIHRSVLSPESKVPPSNQQEIEEKVERVNDLLANPEGIPKVDAVSEAKELVQAHYEATKDKNDPRIVKLQENAEKLNDLIMAINTVEMEKAAKELVKEAEEQKLDLSKKPDQALEPRDNKPLKAGERDNLKEKLEILKQAVQDGVECAEKTVDIKAGEIESTVKKQQAETGDSKNEMQNRIKDKTKEIKDAIETGDPSNALPHFINDIEVANKRDSENKVREGRPIDPESLEKTEEAIEKLKTAANGYNNIKKRVKTEYLPLIKAVEAIIALQEPKKQPPPPVPQHEQSTIHNSNPVAKDSGRKESIQEKYQPKEPIHKEEYQEEEESEAGRHDKDEDAKAKDLHNYEGRLPEDSPIRKSKNKDQADKMEQESKESKKEYRHEVFTEESGDVNPADFDSLREKQKNKRREEKSDRDKLRDGGKDLKDDVVHVGGDEEERVHKPREQDFKKKKPEIIIEQPDDEDERRRAEDEERRRAAEEAKRRAAEDARRREEEEEARRRAAELARQLAEDEARRKAAAEEAERLRKLKELEDEERRKREEALKNLPQDTGADTKAPPERKKTETQELTPPRPSVPPRENDRSGDSKADDRGRSDDKPKIPPTVVLPPPPPEKKMRIYYKPTSTQLDTDPPTNLPVLKPVRYRESSDSSASPKLSPSSSVESFYVEKVKEGEKVYSRKARELKPHEKKARKDKIEEEKKLLSNPNVVVGEKLQPSTEWSRGKRVFLKEKNFVDTKPKEKNEVIEKKIEYFDVVDVNPETEDRIIVEEEGKLRTVIETPEQKQKGQDEEPKFVVMKGDDGEYKVIKLNNLDDNPLNPQDKDSKENKGKPAKPVEVYEKAPLTFHDLPIYSTANLLPTRNKTLSPDELNNFLKQVQAQPGAAVSVWEQTNSSLEGKPVIEGRTNLGGKGMDKAAKTLDTMADDGKISNVDPVKKKKDQEARLKEELAKLNRSDNFSMRTFKGPKYDPKISTPIKVEPIDATPVTINPAEGGKAISGFQLNENKNKGAETDTTMAENEPVEELKRVLPNVKPISDVQPIYSDLSKQCLEVTPDRKEQAKLLDDMFKQVDDEVKKRGLPFDDGMFPAGPSSMVNNSIKSKLPYKNQPWEKLSDQYEVI